MIARSLTWDEVLGVLGRNPIFAAKLGVNYAGAIPPEGVLVKDSVFAPCVLFFRKTDGTLLAIQTDAYKDCKMTPVPGLLDNILGSLPNPVDLAAQVAKWIRNFAFFALGVLVLVLLIQSGVLLRLRR